jgi:alkylhydroperoxidase family enzyme
MFLQLQGQDDATISALRDRNLDEAPIPGNERELLRFVRLVTEHAYRTTDADVQRLRDVGWTDPQIAETVYITGLFALFNRVADAFGLEDPQYQSMGSTPKPNTRPWERISPDQGATPAS